MSGIISYEDFFQQNGCICPVCTEPYETETEEKYPCLLTCQHNICIDCFRNYAKEAEARQICPECREPFQAKENPEKDIKIARSVLALKNLWKLQHGANPAPAPSPAPLPSSAVVSVAAVVKSKELIQPQLPTTIKEGFGITRITNRLSNFNFELELAFAPTIKNMHWEHKVKYLREEYAVAPTEWVTLHEDEQSLQPVALAWLQPKTNYNYEVHWSGIVKQDKDYFWFLFNKIMEEVRSLTETVQMTMRDQVGVSYYLNYNDEHPLYLRFIDFHLRTGIRLDIASNIKTNKAKMTFYPWDIKGERMDQESFGILLSVNTIRRKLDQQLREVLHGKLQLRNLFAFSVVGQSTAEAQLRQLEIDFKSKPESFLVYAIDEVAKGYLQVYRIGNTITILRRGMSIDAQKYGQHFLASILKSMEPGQCLKYSSQYDQKDPLRDDLAEVADFLKLNMKTEFNARTLTFSITK